MVTGCVQDTGALRVTVMKPGKGGGGRGGEMRNVRG